MRYAAFIGWRHRRMRYVVQMRCAAVSEMATLRRFWVTGCDGCSCYHFYAHA